MNRVNHIQKLINGKSAEEILEVVASLNEEQPVFSTSFGYEDQVLTHLIFTRQLSIPVFTIDTGRLFPETYRVYQSTLARYKKSIQVYFPETAALEKLVREKGPFSFYESVQNRNECCYIRKVEPLKRALQGKSIWITGIRAEQSPQRSAMPQVEWDESNQILKLHPLLHWSLEEVRQFIFAHNIPYNALHDKGFVSIGCQPCTRAVKEGEDFRAGRWWWEEAGKKECGLHKTN